MLVITKEVDYEYLLIVFRSASFFELLAEWNRLTRIDPTGVYAFKYAL